MTRIIRTSPNSPNFACRSASLAGGLFVVAFAAFSPSIGHADCKEWKLAPQFELIQTNGFFVRVYPANQSPGQFGGSATSYYRDSEGVYVPTPGQVEGSISGDDVSFTIHWNTGPVGEYTGHISREGLLDGEARDRLNPESTARWSQRPYGDYPTIEPAAKCLDVATAPAAPAPDTRPVRKLGKRLPGTSTTSTLPQPASPAQPPAGGGGREFPTTPPQVTMATVIADVDVYKQPGGQDKDKIGILYSNNKTTKVSLIPPCENNWCHVKGAPVPTGEGFVYSGTPPDFQSLQF
jgi:hypothetical protein